MSEEGNLDIGTHSGGRCEDTEDSTGRRTHEDREGGWSNVSTSQGMPGVLANTRSQERRTVLGASF